MERSHCAVGKKLHQCIQWILDSVQGYDKLVIKFVLWFMSMISLVISVPPVWLMAQNLIEVIWKLMEHPALKDSGMRDITPFPLELETQSPSFDTSQCGVCPN